VPRAKEFGFRDGRRPGIEPGTPGGEVKAAPLLAPVHRSARQKFSRIEKVKIFSARAGKSVKAAGRIARRLR
jgi:hypothetical protein